MIKLPFIVTLQPDELLYSFILRLVEANGFESILEFVQNFISPSKRTLSYDVYYDLYKFLDIVGYEDIQSFYLNTTIYQGIYPLVNKRTSQGFFLDRITKPMILELKYCPICKKTDEVFYYHRAHQMPGVTMCYKHKCALNTYTGPQNEEFREPLKYTNNKTCSKSLEYALFAKALLDEGIQVDLDEILKFIPTDIDYDLQMGEYLKLLPISSNELMRLIRNKNFKNDIQILITLLLFLYKDIDTLKEKLNYNTYDIKGNFKLLSDYRNDLIEVECVRCNKTFITPAHSIMCSNCDISTKTIVKKRNKKTIITPHELPEEFELINKTPKSAYGVFKHIPCGSIFRYNRYNFYRNPKCKLCNTNVSKNKKNKVKKAIRITQKDYILNYLKANYSEKDIIFSDEICIKNFPKSVITDNIKKYVKQGLIKNIDRGIYTFSNKDYTVDEIVNKRFVNKSDEIIGYYCGESFMYEIGLTNKKPNKITIVTNKVETLHGRSIYIKGTEVRIYGSRVRITKDNYLILAVIRFFINETRCNYEANQDVFLRLHDVLREHHIQEDDFKQYYTYFQDWIQERIRKIYKEGC